MSFIQLPQYHTLVSSLRQRAAEPTEDAALQALVEKFRDWRARRASVRTAVPQALRLQTLALLRTHSRARLAATLGVSYAMMAAWQAAAEPAQSSDQPEPSASVAEAGPSPVQVDVGLPRTGPPAPPAFTITTGSGERLTIDGVNDPVRLTALMLAFCSQAGEVSA